MADEQIPREKWIPEIPFDVADWGNKPDPWPGGLFRSEQEREDAERRADDLSRRSLATE